MNRKEYRKEYYKKNKTKWNKYYETQMEDSIKHKKRNEKTKQWKIDNPVKAKQQKKKDDANYHSKMKSDPEYLRKRRDAATEYNNRPEVKAHRKKMQAKHRAKPEVKKKNAEYNKKHHEENQAHYNEQSKKWNKSNPEKRLIISKRHLEKLGLPFKLPSRQYGMALEAWGKSVRKLLGDKCIVCGSTDKLNSHHILYKALHPELSLNINNGVPLCKEHHLEVHRLNPV
jgi:hypothetical protein